ncbi:MAG: hypothetical protein JO250_15350 [Armatimonadetes bacterium]|nr:hypothetical protein [Armatimonadota bacterium]
MVKTISNRLRLLAPALLLLTLALLLLIGPPRTAPAGGWSWKLPPNVVSLDPGRRNPIFFVGERITFAVGGKSATRYEVRDYYGDLVDRGKAAPNMILKSQPPGWYKLYVYDDADQGPPWGKIVGGTMFAVFRHRPGFPPLAPKSAPPGGDGVGDQPTRDTIGMGPERLAVPDASKPDEAIKNLEAEVAIDRAMYLPFDPLRHRVLMVAFPNGTKDLAGVRKIVAHFQNDVTYWEPRNEPNGGSSGADFAVKEMKPFYETVKSVNPRLKVMGPGTVGIGPPGNMLGWLDDFFNAGGAKYIDAFSFHAYNAINGDLIMGRWSLDGLQALLARHHLQDIEKWQTEQGYFAAMYGSYQPSHQGRWTMLQMMLFEQYGIPKEHNHYWYDKSHGFWDVPTWWEEEDGGVDPAAPLLRAWSEELYGTNFQRAYHFGLVGDKLYIGSLFAGPRKRVAAFMSNGLTDGQVDLRVSGPGPLHLVSAFGVARDLPVTRGRATLPVPELPVYVELTPRQTVQVIPDKDGPDLALLPGVTAAASGANTNDIAKIHNGVLENWYYTQQKPDQPWMDDTPTFPAWVELRLPHPMTVRRVIVYAGTPWQSMGTLLDYELQYDDHGRWKTIEHVREPTRTIKVYTPPSRTTVDSFFRDRWIFQHHFPPVTTQKIRLLVHDCTWGGGATKDVVDAGGQTGPHHVTLREIEIYAR